METSCCLCWEALGVITEGGKYCMVLVVTTKAVPVESMLATNCSHPPSLQDPNAHVFVTVVTPPTNKRGFNIVHRWVAAPIYTVSPAFRRRGCLLAVVPESTRSGSLLSR